MIIGTIKFIKRHFIETAEFTKRWRDLGLTDNDLRFLQKVIMENPDIGETMKGTGGIRKMRIKLPNHKGKSGGARVCYIDYDKTQTTILVSVFGKKEKENLSKAEKNALRSFEQILKAKYGEEQHEKEE